MNPLEAVHATMPADVFAIPYDLSLAFGVTFHGDRDLNVYCPFHEIPGKSVTRSCSVSPKGFFKCHVCGAKGTAEKFFARVKGLDISRAEMVLQGKCTLEEALRANGVHQQASGPSARADTSVHRPGEAPLVQEVACARATPDNKGFPPNLIALMQRELRKDYNKHFLDYLHTERGLTDEALDNYKIGCDEWRITIPIDDSMGNLLNIRRYLPTARAKELAVPKMVSHIRGIGTPVLFPARHLWYLKPGDELIIAEGEWDTILNNQHMYSRAPTITNTGGVGVWFPEWTSLLKKYKCTILFDVNDHSSGIVPANHGQICAHKVAESFLREGCAGVRVVALPLPLKYDGGDITDWYVREKRTAKELQECMDAVPYEAR